MTFTRFLNSESAQQPHYLLIGNNIGHSVSPLMHNTALEYHNIPAVYHAVSVSGGELSSLISHFNSPFFMGANITIPYKETLIDTPDRLGAEAGRIGAINTLVKTKDELVGENTDAYGFAEPIREYTERLAGGRAIIFGTGGATKAINFALKNIGMEEVILVSRRPDKYESQNDNMQMCGYEAWPEYAEEADIIVNATPLGMVPNTEASPVEDSQVGCLEGKLCYDIVYNPRNTQFLQQAKKAGSVAIGGLEMLICQGAKSFEMWTGKSFPIQRIQKKLDDVFPH